MKQQPLELILLRRLTESLAVPMFVVDRDGTLVICNDAAARFYAVECSDAGEGEPFRDLAPQVHPTDDDGGPIAVERLPTSMALRTGRPHQASVWVQDRNAIRHRITTTAVPVTSHDGRTLAAMVVFWESEPKQ